MSISIQSFVVGPIMVNCYVIKDADTGKGVVIDPGGNPQDIQDYIRQQHIAIDYVLNTHGHGDHIGANDAICNATDAKLLIHQADADMLTDTRRNLSIYMGFSALSRPADGFLVEGQVIQFGHCELEIIHTPGHSPGGVCLLDRQDQVLFSGDSLFAQSIGRCDFPGASQTDLVAALKKKILVLDDRIRVYPGHGPITEIGWERQNNPFL